MKKQYKSLEPKVIRVKSIYLIRSSYRRPSRGHLRLRATLRPDLGRNVMEMAPEQIDRFWDSLREENGHWLAFGKPATHGSAFLYAPDGSRGQVGVHRLAYQLANGLLDDGVWVLHDWECNIPKCCNPAHLRFGEKHHAAKLTDAQALAIFKDSRPQNVLAQEYGVSQVAISSIKRGDTWRRVTGATPAPLEDW